MWSGYPSYLEQQRYRGGAGKGVVERGGVQPLIGRHMRPLTGILNGVFAQARVISVLLQTLLKLLREKGPNGSHPSGEGLRSVLGTTLSACACP